MRRRGIGSRVLDWLRERTGYERWLRALSGAVLYSALDERLEFDEALHKALNKPVVPYAFSQTWCLGGSSLLVFFNQLVTGVLLTIYYKPSPENAYESVQFITSQIPFGWLIRQMHAWGAHVMMILVVLHMLKVYFNKAYRAPREMTWVVGVLLFWMTMAFAFTGYLLPWDQLSYWATTVGTDIVGATPLVGHFFEVILRGGTNVTGLTLSRFYTVHTIILPWVIVFFLFVHFALIRRLGISEPL